MKQSPLLEKLYIAPGNGGTDAFGTNVAISPTDFEALAEFVDREGIDLIVAGNEDPLVAGLADFSRPRAASAVCGSLPRLSAALEGSKDFAKRFMEANGIPTARYRSFTADTIEEGYRFLEELKAPYVLKADGLAA